MTQDTREIQDILKARHALLRATRDFFCERHFLEVETAYLMATAPPDPFIDPLEVRVGTKGPFFLHTSPEMGMKKLLRARPGSIFQVCKVWRVEDHQELHNTEFTMVEWYREGTWDDVMKETCDLVEFIAGRLKVNEPDRFQTPYPVHYLNDVFIGVMGFSPFGLDRDAFFAALAERAFYGIDEKDDWNSLFFKVLIQKIDNALASERPYVLAGWPASISTMAKTFPSREGAVERFELYMNGLEIANGYSELTDAAAQRQRFIDDNARRRELGKRSFPVDEVFIDAIHDIDGPWAGVSVGLDRLLMALLDRKTIDEVMVGRLKI